MCSGFVTGATSICRAGRLALCLAPAAATRFDVSREVHDSSSNATFAPPAIDVTELRSAVTASVSRRGELTDQMVLINRDISQRHGQLQNQLNVALHEDPLRVLRR